MSRYALNLPGDLKREAEELAKKQGVSLNQFILWSVAEKVGALKQALDDPTFPAITYRRGASGIPTPVLRGTGIHVRTLVVDVHQWGMTPDQVAEEYDLPVGRVAEALAFYDAHKAEIDNSLSVEDDLVAKRALVE